MTTVAYRGGIIAADSRATIESHIMPGGYRKLVVSQRHGVVYGYSGSLNFCASFIRSLEQRKKLPWHDGDNEVLHDDDSRVLIVQWDGAIYSIDCGHWERLDLDYYAIGSGCMASTAAMHMGASAIRSVEIAALCDSGTGGAIVSFDIKNLERPKYLKKKRR